jgi:ferritin
MEQALNGQLKEELYSSHLYLAMSAHLEALNFRGMAKWMRIQAEEERGHGLKFFEYVHERGGSVSLTGIDQPKGQWPTVLALFGAAMAHERSITARINALADQAIAEKDHATAVFLTWFVKEQVEEEATLDPIIKRLEAIGDHPSGLYFLDHELGKRTGA